MARRPTREELESKIRSLEAYAELTAVLFHDKPCARRIMQAYGPTPIASGDWAYYLYGADRGSGGVIMARDGGLLGYAVDVCIRWNASGDPYLRECASQVHRAQKEQSEKRVFYGTQKPSPV